MIGESAKPKPKLKPNPLCTRVADARETRAGCRVQSMDDFGYACFLLVSRVCMASNTLKTENGGSGSTKDRESERCVWGKGIYAMDDGIRSM